MALFGTVHLCWLTGIAGVAIALSLLCRRKQAARAVRLVLGYGIAANELVWWVFRYSHEGIRLTNLPLQLCDLAVWLTVAACLTANPLIVEMAYFIGVAGPGMALLTPDLWSPWPSYPAIYFFVAHGAVLIACIVLPFGKIVEMRPGAAWRAFGAVAVFAALVGAFDAITGANYMYLCRKPASESLLSFFGPWPVYLGGGLVSALLLFWLLSLPFRTSASSAG